MSMMHGRLSRRSASIALRCMANSPRNSAPNPGRRRRSAFLGFGHLVDRAFAQSACPGRAHEHPLRGHHQVLVRRRRRPDAGARTAADAARPRYGGLSCGDGRRLRRPQRRRRLTRNSRDGATNISTCRIARKPAASAAFSTIIMIPATGTPTSLSRRTSDAPSLGSIRAGAAQFQHAMDGRGPRRAIDPPRPLCRIQPAIRSRHDFRAQDRRQCRFDPVVDAAGSEVAMSR